MSSAKPAKKAVAPPADQRIPAKLERWWHNKGRFSVIVTDIIQADGDTWILWFPRENCDDTHLESSIMRTGYITEQPELYQMYANFHDDTGLRVLELQRFLRKFQPDPAPEWNGKPVPLEVVPVEEVKLPEPKLFVPRTDDHMKKAMGMLQKESEAHVKERQKPLVKKLPTPPAKAEPTPASTPA